MPLSRSEGRFGRTSVVFEEEPDLPPAAELTAVGLLMAAFDAVTGFVFHGSEEGLVERKKVRSEIRSLVGATTEARHRTALEEVVEAGILFTLDWAASVVSAPRSGARLLGVRSTARAGETGIDIVGRPGHAGLRPTQLEIHPEIVEAYVAKLRSGQPVAPIEAIRLPDGRVFIIEGHHRYVASQRTGIDVKVFTMDGHGPVGFDWEEVVYLRFVVPD